MCMQREEKTLEIAQYFIEHKSTVRETAKFFGLSKSTIHKYLKVYVPAFCSSYAKAVNDLLALNKSERHIRGGLSTKRKYELKRSL